MTMRPWMVASISMLAVVISGFLYRPALFGFYGFTESQCFFLYAVDAPTAQQAYWTKERCRNAHRSRPSIAQEQAASKTNRESDPNPFAEQGTGGESVADRFGLGARAVYQPGPSPILESAVGSDLMRAAIKTGRGRRDD